MTEYKVSKSLLFAKLMIVSFFLPNRGIFVGYQYLFQLLLFLLYILANGNKIKINKLIIPKWIIIYFFILGICILRHFDTRGVLWNLYDLVPAFAAISIIVNCIICNKNNFYKLIDFLLKIVTVYSILCIIESITGFNMYDFLTNDKVIYLFANEIRFGFVRNRGVFDVSINNGAFLTMNLCLCCYRLLSNRDKNYKLMYLIIFVAAFLGMSRVIWIDLALSQTIIFLGLKTSKKIRYLLIGTLLVSISWIVGSLLPSSFLGQFFNIIDEMIDTTISGIFVNNSTSTVTSESGLYGIGARFDLWVWVFEATKDKLLWGNGFQEIFRHVYTANTVKTSIEVMWLYRLFKTGLIGMFGLIFLQISSLLSSVKNLKKYRKLTQNYFFIRCFFGMCVGLFVAQLGYTSMEDFNFFFIYLGLFVSCLTIELA